LGRKGKEIAIKRTPPARRQLRSPKSYEETYWGTPDKHKGIKTRTTTGETGSLAGRNKRHDGGLVKTTTEKRLGDWGPAGGGGASSLVYLKAKRGGAVGELSGKERVRG